MKHVLTAGLLFGLAIAGSPTSALAAVHDGNWSVLVVTEKGDCDRAYRYEVTVAAGRVNFAGQPGVAVAGTVATNGAVKVSITGGGSQSAQGSGRLATDNGAGTWHGAGRTGACTGRWEASRR
jgi:hypothetical protein